MDLYKNIQQNIQSLGEEFNKDETEIVKEIKSLQKKNQSSINEYLNVRKAALELKGQLEQIVDNKINEDCNDLANDKF